VIEAGVKFFDTAKSYADGSSGEILGRALADFAEP
jgi:aryl-alcohol dehydrogenase-like predicted oxidoreductase